MIMGLHHNVHIHIRLTNKLMFARVETAKICTIASLGVVLMEFVKRLIVGVRVVVRKAVKQRTFARATLARLIQNAGLAAVMLIHAVEENAEISVPTTLRGRLS